MSKTFYTENDDVIERYELVTDRIATINEDKDLPENLQAYFNQVAEFIQTVEIVMDKAVAGELENRSLEECKADHDRIFAIYKAGTYENSFLCPTYAVAELGESLVVHFQQSIID